MRLLLLLAAAGLALAAPDFSGVWKLNPALSHGLGLTSSSSVYYVVEHRDPEFRYQRKYSATGGAARTYVLRSDGKETEGEQAGSHYTYRGAWKGAALEFESTTKMLGSPVTWIDLWELSAGGKRLTVTRRMRQGGGAVEQAVGVDTRPDQVMVFDRQ